MKVFGALEQFCAVNQAGVISAIIVHAPKSGVYFRHQGIVAQYRYVAVRRYFVQQDTVFVACLYALWQYQSVQKSGDITQCARVNGGRNDYRNASGLFNSGNLACELIAGAECNITSRNHYFCCLDDSDSILAFCQAEFFDRAHADRSSDWSSLYVDRYDSVYCAFFNLCNFTCELISCWEFHFLPPVF